MRALLPLSVLLVAGAAAASPQFPQGISDHLDGAPVQQCTICHNDLVGGIGTVVKPFGQAMQARGLVLENVPSLNTALDQMAADAVDSDGDGVTDVDELKAGTDPNVANAAEGEGEGAQPPLPQPITYGFGCGASSPAPLWAAGLLAALVFWRRTRRR